MNVDDDVDVLECTVNVLKAVLRGKGEKTSGSKAELIGRLQQLGVKRIKRTTLNGVETSLQREECGQGEMVEKLVGDVNGLRGVVETLAKQFEEFLLANRSQQQTVPYENAVVHTEIPATTTTTITTTTAISTESVATAASGTGVNTVQTYADVFGMRTAHVSAAQTVRAESDYAYPSVRDSSVQNTTTATTVGGTFNEQQRYDPNIYMAPNLMASYGNNQQAVRINSSNCNARDIASMLPEFDPCNSDVSSTQFIERVDQLKQVHGWTDGLLLVAVHTKLQGGAKLWVNSQPVFLRLADFVSAFLTDFPCVINTADIHIQMMNTGMTRGEGAVRYFYRMLALGRRGRFEEKAITRYIVNGLLDENLKRSLSVMNFSKCSDLLYALTNLDGATNQKTMTSSGQSTSQPPKFKEPAQQKDNNNVGKSNVVCYRCREKGHIAKNCTQRRKQDTSPAQINKIAPEVKCQELCKRVTLVGNQAITCEALIDSGSGKSLIKRVVADKCGGVRLKCSEMLVGFAGGELHCREKIKVEIKIDDSSYPADLLIVDDLVMSHDAIIGIDVLAKGTIIIEKGVCRVMSIGSKKIDVDEKLSSDEVDQLNHVLNSYAHCFGEKLQELGKSQRFKMDIAVTSSKPIVKRPYAVPIPKQKIVEQIVDELLTLGIVRPSHSSYASPIVLVQKPNGEHRLCVDFRGLNAITEKQPWQMPTVDGVLATLADKRIFTTLDMMSGYYQLELEESAKKFTAFVTHHGHFEFCRMPFGLRNAPCAFQRMMSELIAPLNKSVISYVDEVIIPTDTVENNIRILIKFLQLVEKEGLTLRLSKCSFLKSVISFLGHQVDENGVSPGVSKAQAIQSYPVPGNQSEVRRFLGLAGFFRKFVPHFAMIARPLTALLKKEASFVWSSDCQGAFHSLVQALTNPPILTIYQVDREHQLHTDASSVGLAAILLQQEGDVFKPVAFYSRACTTAEAKYHAYELEVLAVVTACERFRMFLLGKHFTIVTDCQAISTVKLDKALVPRVSRWFLKLLEYDHDIVHRSGDTMRHVDALSRAPIASNVEISDVSSRVLMITVTDWVSSLQQDATIKDIIEVLAGEKYSEHKKQFNKEFCVRNHRLFRKSEDNQQLLFVPKGMRWRIAKLCHDDAGHPGVEGTKKRILQHFWFPRILNFVKGYIKSCIECSYHREPRQKQCELHGMDILGPFIKSRRGNQYLLVIVDALSRYSVIAPVKTTKTKPVIDTLNQMTAYFGLPQRLITDRGTAFTSTSFADFCETNNIQHIKVAVRTPRANGLAERVNQAVLSYLKPSVNDQRDWDCQARMIQWSLNTTPNTTTKKAPMDLVYDFPLRDLSGNKLLVALHDDVNIQMNTRRAEAIDNINRAREKWKERFDAKHKTPIPYQEGDLILLESPAPATGESRKLEPKYKGPLVITKVLRYDRYVVEEIEGVQKSTRRYTAVVASDKIKPWCSLFPDADEEELSEDAEDLTRDE